MRAIAGLSRGNHGEVRISADLGASVEVTARSLRRFGTIANSKTPKAQTGCSPCLRRIFVIMVRFPDRFKTACTAMHSQRIGSSKNSDSHHNVVTRVTESE